MIGNAKEAKFKNDIAIVKDTKSLKDSKALINDTKTDYTGVIQDNYKDRLVIGEDEILYYKGEDPDEEKWAKELGVFRKKDIPEDWIDISETTPSDGISLLIGKPEYCEATVNFKVTTTSGSYKVDWGDGESNIYTDGDEAIHVYSKNTEKLTKDGYLFKVNITPNLGEITIFKNLQDCPYILWCQVGCNTLTDCSSMLLGCSGLRKFGTDSKNAFNNVTDMRGMFRNCSSLTTIPTFNTNNVILMGTMFYGCSNLLTIPKLDTSNVTYMGSMFQYCTNLSTVSFINMSKVNDPYGIFEGCTNLTSVNVSNSELTIDQINTLFYQLPRVASGKIDITGNPGVGECERSIATGKGWTVIP